MTIHLAPITLAGFRALESGDTATAGRLIGHPVPAAFQATVEIWTYMITLLADDPANAAWVMNAVVDGDTIVGNAGFKGAPVDGRVELGYSIAPAHRRRGLAVTAVGLLIRRARQEPTVDEVIARITPDNHASVGVVTKAGFVPTEDHDHPRWGRQLQFVHPTPRLGDVTD